MRPASKPILCYVTDRHSLKADLPDSEGEHSLIATIERAARAGVNWIQIREKDLPAARLAALVRSAKSRTPADARILVNDRLDVALAAGADGVHLGEDSFPAEQVTAFLRSERHRGLARQSFLVGVSTHSAESAKAAERAGANYIFFGPVFATPSKAAYGPPQGTGRLAEVCRQASIPVLAIGGITERNAGECFEAGAAGIAAIRMFQEPADLAQLVEKLQALARRASKSAP